MATAAVHPIWSAFNHKMASALTGYLLEPERIVSATKPELWQAVATAFPVLRYVRQQAEEFNCPRVFYAISAPSPLHTAKARLGPLHLVGARADGRTRPHTSWTRGSRSLSVAPPKLQTFPDEVTFAQAYSISAGHPLDGVDFMSPDNRPGGKADLSKRAPGAVHLGPPSSTPRSAKVGPPVSTRASTPTPKPKSKAKAKGVAATPAPTPGAGPSMSLRTRAAAASPSPEGPAVSSLKRGRSPEGLARLPTPVPASKAPAKKRARVKVTNGIQEEPAPESDDDNERVRVKHMPNRPAGSVVPEYDYSVNKPSVVNALAKALDAALKFKNHISSAEIQASDTGFNVAADVPTDNGLLYVIRTKPKKPVARFFSHIAPFSIARQTKSKAKKEDVEREPKYMPLPKIPSEPILEVDLADAGLPPSSCVMCILRNVACTRIGFGASCVQCQLSEPKLCDHVKTIEELIIFHSEIARNYAMASDVTEVILSEFVASAKRAQTAGMLYREASDDLRVRFRWFIAHVFKCIRLMGTAKFFERFAGAGASLAVQRHVQLLIEQFNWAERPDATRGDTVPVDYTHLDAERFFSTSFDALEVDDFFNLDPEDPFGLIAVGIDETSVPTVYLDPMPTVTQRPGQLRYPLNDEGPSLSKINNAPSDAEVEPEDEDGEVGTEDGDEETVEGNGTKAAGEDDVEMADAGGEVLEEDGEEAPQSSKKPSSRRSLVTPENQPRPVKKSTRGKSSRRRGR
ncbi:hypothetical protein C8F04DRAFT_1178234 [Mycena alexandri]|uniref:Uncharacterized protein n=1 Tax=Mycena alexandri TaxID=1745969 RepID=A0AAD6T834_9AGAR|nr:hypothetical protein C8F04DRAFT_1178234 [Mycena alexandri]